MHDANELWRLSAQEALEEFRARRLSPIELMRSVIDRCEAVEPRVNALPFCFFEEALVGAREAEARYMGRGDPPRPLEGLPVAIKEESPIAGKPWTQASLIFKDVVADITHPVPRRILEAGGVVHALTATPEFSCVPWTNSRLNGITHNPWNLAYSPGGSSGGSGASLASGTCLLASGSDFGGSIRIPASFSGVVGYKPPYGRVPSIPPFNLDYYNHEGPLARTVDDCALFYDVIEGQDPFDIATIPSRQQGIGTGTDIHGLRIALFPTLGGLHVDARVLANALAAGETLRELGAEVDEIEPPWDVNELNAAGSDHLRLLFGTFLKTLESEYRDSLSDYVLDFVKICEGQADPAASLEAEGRLFMVLAEVFARYDAVVSPTVGYAGIPADHASLLDMPAVNGVKMGAFWEALPTAAFNMFSRCPVISVPSGVAENGVPSGIQIAAAPFAEDTVFTIARAFELARQWTGLAPLVGTTDAPARAVPTATGPSGS